MRFNDPDPYRRRVLAGIAGTLTAAQAKPLSPLKPVKMGEVQTIDGIAFMRAETPPAIVRQSWRLQQTATVTKPVMETSQDPPVRDFRDYLEKKVAREPDRMRQLEMVNLYVNDRVKEIADDKIYVSSDLWAPPLNTLMIGGDCEDLALLKFWGLAHIGFDRKDMYLVCGVTRAVVTPTFHAVLVVIFRPSTGVMLDNLSRQLHVTKESARFEPTYALNEYGFWRVETPNPADRIYWDNIASAINPG